MTFKREDSRQTVLGIYGPNGGGKSAVLSAFALLRDVLEGNEIDKEVISKEQGYATISAFFEDTETSNEYRYNLTVSAKRKKMFEGLSSKRGMGGYADGLGLLAAFKEALRGKIQVWPISERLSFMSMKGDEQSEVLLGTDDERTAISRLNDILSSLMVPLSLVSDENGIRGEVNGKTIPLSSEAQGALNLLPLIRSFERFLYEPDFILVVDELDSGLFEYVYGELLSRLFERGLGTLLFSAHNLRGLETLPYYAASFITSDPLKRFVTIKPKKGENLRSTYLRLLSLNDPFIGHDLQGKIPEFPYKLGKGHGN